MKLFFFFFFFLPTPLTLRPLFLCFTMKKRCESQSCLALLALSITALSLTQTALSTDFVFNGFHSTDPILFVGNATVDSADKTLTLTNHSTVSIGRAFYATKIPAKRSNSSLPFSTSFIFAMAPRRGVLSGHGLVFLFSPAVGFTGTPAAQNLGFINRTDNGRPENHIFGVEFDVFKNQEFNDIDANHVGIDVNSLNSAVAHEAGVWAGESKFRPLKLNSGDNYQVWIDYNNSIVTVAMARAGERKPRLPLLRYDRDLSDIFIDDMFVGFTSSTGELIQSHKILAWSFSNDNFSLSESLLTANLPSFVIPKESIFKNTAFLAVFAVSIAVIIVLAGLLAMCLTKRHRRIAKERAEMEEWELEYWPHRMSQREVEDATEGFSEKNVIGSGGNGKVYRGVLKGGAEVAVKRLSRGSDGTREFLAEVSSLGRLRHRSLVGLRGWCKRDRGVFVLVYDYMENGSLDKRVYRDSDESLNLGFDDRIRILNDVARGVLYLHEGWESQVLHRDIKASNVLLDKDMNGKLGDFGLARVHSHAHVAATTRVVGTVGYLAPEVVRNGRVSAQSDVFGFGALVLEVVCGRRPIEEGKPPLVEWVWETMSKGNLLEAVDERLRAKGEFDKEVAERVLQLGLLCAYPDPASRPNMRQVVKILEGNEGVGELESEEDMGKYLLEKVKNGNLWTSFSRIVGYGSHPTFEDIRESLSSSMSWSNTIVEGLLKNGERKSQGRFATI